MDREDGRGLRADRRLDGGRIDVRRRCVDIDEHRCRPRVHVALGRGPEGVRRDDDFVTGTDPRCAQHEVDGAGPRREADSVTGSAKRCQLTFEAFDLGP